MRKRDLIRNLDLAKSRIEVLEDIICPARQHKWLADHDNECYICVRCKKVKWFDYAEY